MFISLQVAETIGVLFSCKRNGVAALITPKENKLNTVLLSVIFVDVHSLNAAPGFLTTVNPINIMPKLLYVYFRWTNVAG